MLFDKRESIKFPTLSLHNLLLFLLLLLFFLNRKSHSYANCKNTCKILKLPNSARPKAKPSRTERKKEKEREKALSKSYEICGKRVADTYRYRFIASKRCLVDARSLDKRQSDFRKSHGKEGEVKKVIRNHLAHC